MKARPGQRRPPPDVTQPPRPDPRHNQRVRTRQAIIKATQALVEAGGTPSVAEAADAALVSRATAYRYFPSQAALLIEASLLPGLPTAEEVFGPPDAPMDPCDRVALLSDLMYDHISRRENEFRVFLREQLVSALDDSKTESITPPGFRIPLIDAALEPLGGRLTAKELNRLKHALSVLIGTEAVLTCRDVLHLDHDTGRTDMTWACRAVVQGAIAQADARRQRNADKAAQREKATPPRLT